MTKFQFGDEYTFEGENGVCFTKGKVYDIKRKNSLMVYFEDDFLREHGVSYDFLVSHFKPIKPTKNQRISALEKEVAELKKVVEGLTQVEPAPTSVSMLDLVHEVCEKEARQNQTNNQKRAAIIEKAKLFVEERKACREGDEVNQDKVNGNSTSRNHWYDTDFVTKNNKVVALVYWLEYGKKRTRSPKEIGRSKCHPHDVFNEHIGKAIALGRALGLDVSEFEQAVQPDEVVVGMEIQYKDDFPNHPNEKRTIKSVGSKRLWFTNGKNFGQHYDEMILDMAFITNDTNAQYEEAKVHESNKAF